MCSIVMKTKFVEIWLHQFETIFLEETNMIVSF